MFWQDIMQLSQNIAFHSAKTNDKTLFWQIYFYPQMPTKRLPSAQYVAISIVSLLKSNIAPEPFSGRTARPFHLAGTVLA